MYYYCYYNYVLIGPSIWIIRYTKSFKHVFVVCRHLLLSSFYDACCL